MVTANMLTVQAGTNCPQGGDSGQWGAEHTEDHQSERDRLGRRDDKPVTMFLTKQNATTKIEISSMDFPMRSHLFAVALSVFATSTRADVLYECDRFNDRVVAMEGTNVLWDIKTDREPISVALTKDGTQLFVANHLTSIKGDSWESAAVVDVIDIEQRAIVKKITLRPGSGMLREIVISPDGRHAIVSHTLSHFHFLLWKVRFGWVNQNVISVLDVDNLSLLGVIGLDDMERGAATPWGLCWEEDVLCVTHAGTHELSVINVSAMIDKLNALPDAKALRKSAERDVFYRRPQYKKAEFKDEVINDFDFLQGIRTRISLNGLGPRSVTIAGGKAHVSHFFSNSKDIVDLETMNIVESTATNEVQNLGEFYFNDATICFQGWQSCASCHPDGRSDGFNWDLFNDGTSNPKNTKSLLLSHRTPPVMSMAVRQNAQIAVRAGIKHILFNKAADPRIAEHLDKYLLSLEPVKSPHAGTEAGKRIFDDRCGHCHSGPWYTDQQSYSVGTLGSYDDFEDTFDTPTLVEVWRTAPYLHDGTAASIKEVIVDSNPSDEHGITSDLSAGELGELIGYVLSL